MKVGAQMRKQADNKWQLSGHVIEEEPVTDDTNGETSGETVESSALHPRAAIRK